MKFIYFLIFVILTISISCSQNKVKIKNDLELNHLYDSIKKIQLLEYGVLPTSNVTAYYDSNGFIYKEEFNNKNIKIVDRNEDYQIQNIFNIDMNRDTTSHLTYKYTKGKLTSITKNANSKVVAKWNYEYNENPKYKTENLYVKGELILKMEYSSDEDRLKEITKEYDNENNLNKIITHQFFPKEYYSCINTQVFFDETMSINSKTYLYYDKHNNVIRQVVTRNGDTLYEDTYLYELDNHNNWIKKFYYNDDTSFVVSERFITYY